MQHILVRSEQCRVYYEDTRDFFVINYGTAALLNDLDVRIRSKFILSNTIIKDHDGVIKAIRNRREEFVGGQAYYNVDNNHIILCSPALRELFKRIPNKLYFKKL